MGILAGLVTALLIWGFSAWYRRRHPKKENTVESDGPWCAQCGYPVRGIADQSCPECGADLLRDGSVSVWNRHLKLEFIAQGLVILLGGLTLAMLTPRELMPKPQAQIMNLWLRAPASGLYQDVMVLAQSSERVRWFWAKTWPLDDVNSISVRIQLNTGVEMYTWRDDQGGWHVHGVAESFETLALSVHALFGLAGMHPGNPILNAEIALLQQICDEVAAGTLPRDGPTTTLFRPELQVFLSQTSRQTRTFWLGRSVMVFIVLSPLIYWLIWLSYRSIHEKAIKQLAPEVPFDSERNALRQRVAD